ncbi:hypothetical protein KL930_000708 [Ogataea haglerorum]|nr:hypothetical protein KL915_000710 [Ogataea haglerorum]KAG7711492.1 hypothetical protein KL914_000134 [Ogataea haglerorum]KAG7712263.1 hypothetical protein KL950_000134 [Ogataea haglerorum]KAG7781486.1 hypothetical protein KL922_000408 [Ogataea haglerorum]KAG7782246.1 hypothetical protein KL930_000708 [Ogataea haglerorum]
MASAQDLVKQHRFLMLSKSWCPDCHYAIAVFKKYKVLDKITLVELDKMPPKEAAELEKQFTALSGRKWVPTIFFNGAVFGTEQTLKELESRDLLPSAFEKAAWHPDGCERQGDLSQSGVRTVLRRGCCCAAHDHTSLRASKKGTSNGASNGRSNGRGEAKRALCTNSGSRRCRAGVCSCEQGHVAGGGARVIAGSPPLLHTLPQPTPLRQAPGLGAISLEVVPLDRSAGHLVQSCIN